MLEIKINDRIAKAEMGRDGNKALMHVYSILFNGKSYNIELIKRQRHVNQIIDAETKYLGIKRVQQQKKTIARARKSGDPG